MRADRHFGARHLLEDSTRYVYLRVTSRAGWPPSVQSTQAHTANREERMAALRLDQARIGAAGAIVGTPEAQVTPEPGRYEIDTSCSAVTFRTRHLFGLAPVRGSFTIRAGTIDVAEPPADSSVHVHIDPASGAGRRTGGGSATSRAPHPAGSGRAPARSAPSSSAWLPGRPVTASHSSPDSRSSTEVSSKNVRTWSLWCSSTSSAR